MKMNIGRRTATLVAEFNPQKPMVLNWDEELMEDLTGDQKVNRLPIVVSGSGVEQLLAIPKLSAGTGQAMAHAMMEVKFICLGGQGEN